MSAPATRAGLFNTRGSSLVERAGTKKERGEPNRAGRRLGGVRPLPHACDGLCDGHVDEHGGRGLALGRTVDVHLDGRRDEVLHHALKLGGEGPSERKRARVSELKGAVSPPPPDRVCAPSPASSARRPCLAPQRVLQCLRAPPGEEAAAIGRQTRPRCFPNFTSAIGVQHTAYMSSFH